MQEHGESTKIRLLFISIAVYLISGIMFVQLFTLQVVRGEAYLRQSEENRTQIIRIPAYRSIIYDRTRQNKLAHNRKSLAIVVIPSNLPENIEEKEATLSNASALLDIPIEQIKQTIDEQAFDKYTPVVLKHDIDYGTLVKFAENYQLYPGLMWENRPRRVYDLEKKASQVIGYTGIISRPELNRLRSNPEYHFGTILGKMGIERHYDEIIRGKEGLLERTVDARQNVLEQTIRLDPLPGDPIVLTIHKDLQAKAYELFGERIGAVVVTKPSTGEILALVSIPGFDPNIFTDRFSTEEFFILRDDESKPFLNRAIQGVYPPSSVFKMISGSAILDSDFTPSKSVTCRGWHRIGNRVFRCWDTHGPNIDFVKGIAHSCDVYFYTAGLYIGREKILDFARAYGMDKRTQIDIPGETFGLIPEMEWFTRRYRRPWSHGDTANISIGQGDLLSTPIGMNAMTMAIVNDGVIYKPFLLKEILSIVDRQPKWEKKPEVLRKVNLSPEQFALLRKSMEDVTKYGTARWLQYLTPVPIAGKTGTGQAGEGKENHAWFTAYAPADFTDIDDVIVVTVVVEHGGGGSAVAAPIAARLIDHYFRNILKRDYRFKRSASSAPAARQSQNESGEG
jgi:penicillin-binding protein 2